MLQSCYFKVFVTMLYKIHWLWRKFILWLLILLARFIVLDFFKCFTVRDWKLILIGGYCYCFLTFSLYVPHSLTVFSYFCLIFPNHVWHLILGSCPGKILARSTSCYPQPLSHSAVSLCNVCLCPWAFSWCNSLR